MKNRWKFLVVLTLCCVLSFPPSSCMAQGDGYTYTVSLSAGEQGTLCIEDGMSIAVEGGGNYKISLDEDGKTVWITGLTAANHVRFLNSAVVLDKESKYYVRGVREGGRDNNTVSLSYFSVERDQDYVVAYGIKGNLTQYTVNYVDGSGNVLYPPQTYYGNVGDKPVIAYLYVEGYQPQAYNLTRTLQSDSSRNVFTFVYTPVPVRGTGGAASEPGSGDETMPGGNVPGPSGTGTVPGGNVPGPGGTGTAPGGNVPESGGTGTVPGGNESLPGEEDTGQAGLQPGEEGSEQQGPEEIIDEDEIPLAEPAGMNGEEGTFAAANRKKLRNVWIAGGIGIAAVLILGSGLYVSQRMKKTARRKKMERDEDEA